MIRRLPCNGGYIQTSSAPPLWRPGGSRKNSSSTQPVPKAWVPEPSGQVGQSIVHRVHLAAVKGFKG